jgi:CheY-like chemotaxis protein
MMEDTFKSLRVLLVDDEAFFQQIMVRLLFTLGVTNVEVAKNGQHALDVLASATVPISLVISDIEMPEMGGFELARRIRLGAVPKYKEVPILMLTGHSTEENLMKGRIHRIQGFIVKPTSADILKRNIARIFTPK